MKERRVKMYIPRTLGKEIKEAAKTSAVIGILGPRQSGKTTLATKVFPDYIYVSLENDTTREFAKNDPKGFLQQYDNEKGLIIDEAQRVPALFSYLQGIVDFNYRPGFYVLTGSQNFLLMKTITQTLAGRISLHTLLPLSITELKNAQLLSNSYTETIVKGFYPSIYSKKIKSITKWYDDYIKTYVQRDVREIQSIVDLNAFTRFIRLCAGRIGQVVNLNSLADDCGIDARTVKSWLSILEASFIIYLLHPHYKNFSKRLIKAPKIFFYDSGLACALLGIDSVEALLPHYLRGGLFETMIISDFYKLYYNRDREPHLYFWRDKTGHEVDLIIERAQYLYPVEIKASQTPSMSYFKGLAYWNKLADADPKNSFVVYGGDENQQRSKGNIVSWKDTDKIYFDITSQ